MTFSKLAAAAAEPPNGGTGNRLFHFEIRTVVLQQIELMRCWIKFAGATMRKAIILIEPAAIDKCACSLYDGGHLLRGVGQN